MHVSVAKRFALAAVASAVVGCTHLDRQEAAKLAGEGKSWVTVVRSTHGDTRAGLRRGAESELITACFDRERPVSAQQLESMRQLCEVVTARTQVMDALFTTYASFEKLANYDAAAEVESALNSLSDAANSYAKTLGQNEQAVAKVTGIVTGKGGGWIASKVQERQLRESSRLIRERLTFLQTHIEREVKALTRINQETSRANERAALQLLTAGMGDPEPLLKDLLSFVGLNYDRAQGLALLKEECKSHAAARQSFAEARRKDPTVKEPPPPPLLQALTAVINQRVAERIATQSELLSEIQKTLAALIQAHQSLEKGKPIDPASLTQRIILLRQILEEYQKTKA